MSKLFSKNKLGLKLLLATAIALLIGFLFVRISMKVSYYFMDKKYLSQEYMEQQESKKIQNFQDFVTTNNLSKKDSHRFNEWANKEDYIILELYDGKEHVYSSYSDEVAADEIVTDTDEGEIGSDDSFERYAYTINFNDGTLGALLYSYYEVGIYNAVNTILTVAGFLLAIAILLVYAQKKTDYILLLDQELKILESGDLHHPISVREGDELGDLAQGIEDMRVAFIQRQGSEENARRANKELITAMSHDLRSPLTSLIGYLDILRLDKQENAQQEGVFLEKAYRKTIQIKEMSDKLFEYFLVYDEDIAALELKKENGTELFNQLLGESIFDLENHGFSVAYHLAIEDFEIAINSSLLVRLFDNIFSNIVKYAQRGTEVFISSTIRGNKLEIKIINDIDKSQDLSSSSGLGLSVCRMIMEAHGGSYHSTEASFQYTSTLVFPISLNDA